MVADAAIVELAPAKLNLFLEVTGRRDDGYHLLDSLVVFTDIGDTVAAHPSDTLDLIYDGPFADGLPPPDENLAFRAATALRAMFDIDQGAALKLTKSLPVASGIGGGSADAAATLRACARLWNIDLDTPGVRALALSLGADVPVCLAGRSAIMRGIGDELRFLAHVPRLFGVLVNPGQETPTPAVFKARDGEFSRSRDWIDVARTAADFHTALKDRRNDLQAAAVSISPAIADVLAAFGEQQGVQAVRMSGSGATCFGLFADIRATTAAATALAGVRADWWVSAFQSGGS